METNLIKLQRESERIAPDARLEERTAMLVRADIGPKHIVCDVPAWGGYLARGIDNPARVICLDPSEAMVNCPGARVIGSSPLRHALADATVDRLVSLVGMHHHPSPRSFVAESLRVLRSQGLAVFAEVIEGTAVAAFLNTEVDRYSERGHKGTFFKEGELTALMRLAGFVVRSEDVVNLHWRFDAASQMIGYMKNLFAMVKATDAEVFAAIENHFSVVEEGGQICLPWVLVYGVGAKS